MNSLWCNGGWYPPRELPASVLDRGALLGFGLFETLLARQGRPVFAPRHLARLAAGCARFGWEDPRVRFPELERSMVELIARESLAGERARIRLTVTAGSGPLAGLAPGGDALVWMAALPLDEFPESVAVDRCPWPVNEKSPLAGLKCSSYAERVTALAEARRRGYQETLCFNGAGHLCEAAAANVFLVRDGVLITPSLDSGCLPGVTRAVVLELAASLGMATEERQVPDAELATAGELFLTSALRGPVTVSREQNRTLAEPVWTPQLRRLWLEHTLRE